MIGLIQRVRHARVDIAGNTVGKIDTGLLVLLGVETHDNQTSAKKLLDKILCYRIFSDENGKMNLNIQQVNGSLLVVSQFTLTANTKSGHRPSFSSGASPDLARELYQYFCAQAATQIHTQTGEFAADMQVHLTNDGPVTFWLNT